MAIKVQAIVAAGGLGVRLKSSKPKALVLLRKKPIVYYCLKALEQNRQIQGIVLVVPRNLLIQFKRLVARYRFSKVTKVVAGGKSRCVSVRKGLKALDHDTTFVLVHDAARPFLQDELINSLIRACLKVGAVIVAVPVKPTIKEAYGARLTVKRTLKRDNLWEVQTPQVFWKTILEKAHKIKVTKDVTDDACLVEDLGHAVKIVKGDESNIKITTPEDLLIAETFLKKYKSPQSRRS